MNIVFFDYFSVVFFVMHFFGTKTDVISNLIPLYVIFVTEIAKQDAALLRNISHGKIKRYNTRRYIFFCIL